MRWPSVGRFLELVARIGADPAESKEERVRRLIFCTTLVFGTPVCLVMAVAFAAFGARLAATLMFIGGAYWSGALLLFAVLRRGLNSFALVSQLFCVLFAFVAVVSLGGPIHSGGLILLGLTGPFYALVFPRPRRAAWVFVAYVVSLVVSIGLAGRVPWARPLSPLANLVMFVITLAVLSIFVFLMLFFFVRERDRALSLLREAQEKISRLLESSPGASQTIPGWSRSLAEELGATIGADAIGIWEIEKESLTPLSDGGLSAPSVDELKGLVSPLGQRFLERADGVVVPVRGMSGELCGAVVISGRVLTWGESERRLVTGFAHQLGAALDVSRMRRQLAAAEERRAATRREMQERGIATLQICPGCGRCYDHTVTACTADGRRMESPRALPYRLLNRYRFLQMLGQGGMGTVLAAQDEKLGRDVAIKLIRPEHFNNADLKRRFEREARTVAHIQHPGVIALYDSGELEDGTAFLVMEKLTGCDLALLINAYGRGKPRQVAALVRQGCAALGAAHRAGVVHRDVKPENIFLVDESGEFRVKVLDFGLAKSMTVEKGLTQTGVVLGTPTYMSPEQVQGQEMDARTDVYSFAAVCYEALTGKKAVSGADLGRILINVLNVAPAPPSSFLAGVPPEVDAAFESALAKDRDRRLKDIELWGASFAESLEKAPVDPEAAGWPLPRDAFTRTGESQPSGAVTLGSPRDLLIAPREAG